jgi:hypothetical protein
MDPQVENAFDYMQKRLRQQPVEARVLSKFPKWSNMTRVERKTLLVRGSLFTLCGWLVLEYIASRAPSS